MLAALDGDVERVKALLAGGAAVNARDRKGMTAVMWATAEVTPLLLERGADMQARDNFGRTALSYAAYLENLSRVRLLADHGAGVNTRDSDGWTPLCFALDGACLHARQGRWPLNEEVLMAVDKTRQWDRASPVEVVRFLLDRGASVNARDRKGRSPLLLFAQREMLAGAAQDELLVNSLLANGADVNAQDNEGNTVLMWRAMWLDAGMVRLLLEHGADIRRRRRDGGTALSIVSTTRWGPGACGARALIKALLKAASASDPEKAKQL